MPSVELQSIQCVNGIGGRFPRQERDVRAVTRVTIVLAAGDNNLVDLAKLAEELGPFQKLDRK